MDLKELQQFIDIEDKRIRSKYNNYPDEEKRAYARTVKLNEEVGELCDAMLGYYGKQRDNKINGKNYQKLESEFSDVIITTFLLAKQMNVDIEKSLKNKINKINKRYK